ncbi:MAG: DUF3144 domain-containing protein [Pseudomonadota bacterium]
MSTPSGDGADFAEYANRFMSIANGAMDTFDRSIVNAAFLYGCARYNAYVVQAQGAPAGEVDPVSVAYLRECYEKELTSHMSERLVKGTPAKVQDETRTALTALDLMDQARRTEFLDLADRYVNTANALTAETDIGRISAMIMHACARFNVFLMQTGGLEAGRVDAERRDAYADMYETLLRRHLREKLVGRPE